MNGHSPCGGNLLVVITPSWCPGVPENAGKHRPTYGVNRRAVPTLRISFTGISRIRHLLSDDSPVEAFVRPELSPIQ